MKISRNELAQIVDFFFEAAPATYAAETPTIPLITFPDCSKGYAYGHGSYRYEDHWFSNGDNSFGWTIIFLDSRPVWFMTYSGYCRDQETIPFLKECLRSAYSERKFLAGRGPKEAVDIDRDLVYTNDCGGDFHLLSSFLPRSNSHRSLR